MRPIHCATLPWFLGFSHDRLSINSSTVKGRLLPMKRLVEGIGNVEQISNELFDYLLQFPFPSGFRFPNPSRYYFESIDKIFGYNVVGIFRRFSYNWRHLLFIPNFTALRMLTRIIQKGLDPNLTINNNHEPSTPLKYALRHMHQKDFGHLILSFKEDEKSEDSGESNNERNTDTTDYGELNMLSEDTKVTPWCIVTTLIKANADIYHFDSRNFENASDWWNIRTPWEYAMLYGVQDEWFTALRECGLDPDEVSIEDIQRCKQAMRLYGAQRTGVDEEDLALPSTTGLRCRKCHRKYCPEGHGYSPLDDG